MDPSQREVTLRRRCFSLALARAHPLGLPLPVRGERAGGEGSSVTQIHPTLALLAGGAGTRMGKPKAWLQYNNQPILEYLLDRWRWPGETLLITSPGRERPPGSSRFTREVIDPLPDQGPLRGMLTALQSSHTDTLIIATCDMPLIDNDHFTWLADQLSR